MRVLIIGNYDMGLLKFRRELIEELIHNEHDVYVSIPDGRYVEELTCLGCRVIITKIDRRGMNPFVEQNLYWSYCKLIKQIQPDKILTYTVKPNIYGGIAAKKYGVPQIANITGLGTAIENGGIKSKVLLKIYKRGLANSQVVFFQNYTNYSFFCEQQGIIAGRTDVIPGSGVNLKMHPFEPYPETSNQLVFLVIGRIMKNKGIDEILYAASIVKKLFPTVLIRIIGFYEDEYQDKIISAVNNGIIEFCGLQDDVHSFIKNSHATISASYHEGMSNVLLETAAAGRPVIATDVPGSIETFEPGVSGIPFRARDPEDLVRAIKEFIELPYEKKAEMGIAGRRRMEQLFDRQIVVKKYMEEIEKEV